MRLLVVGGSSYLGQSLVPLAMAAGFEVGATFWQQPVWPMGQGWQLDVREATAVTHLFSHFRPHVVIHLAGSNRTADMEAVIGQGTAHVAAATAALGARLIYLSTDVIFNGRSGCLYDETAIATPVNAYGRAKAAAEAVVARCPNHVIVRTSLIYGRQQVDHGTAWLVDAFQNGRPVQLFTNQLRNPVWRQTLSQACLELADHSYMGILHVTGQQSLSRALFAQKMLAWWGISPPASLTMGEAQGDHWPLDCRLDLRRATAVLHTPLPGVDEVLALTRTSQQTL